MTFRETHREAREDARPPGAGGAHGASAPRAVSAPAPRASADVSPGASPRAVPAPAPQACAASARPAPAPCATKSLGSGRAPEIKAVPSVVVAHGTKGTLAGYASLFGVVDLGRDAVMPGAFRASLARRGASGVKMLFGHDPAQPVGVWERIEEDRRGLRVRGRLNLEVARARELHALLKQGAFDGLSIGFKAGRARRDPRTGVRRIAELDLWEVSLVVFPMLPGARLDALDAAARAG